jgi:DNA-binding transcriptional ArsR family regulator
LDSQHLEVLEAAGLVETRREGRYKFHHINTRPLEPIIKRWLSKPGKDAGGRPDSGADTDGNRDRDEDQTGERAR